ncbi:HAD-IA family hydrolase [Alteraurantiacibacter buctensis]|uniref:HAD-IA family hydrolase n=1 Tax=Alteraurantiacibacter buctensis TaxID=1503981 RepID=A0A844Z0N1_9SPHN|nr:HAD-IA family hydrolase [Alteraurantiacibacter buctensis]MXO72710.1 HAD-IA family hydrolase [Alteraurantiacibacter buctensis]
MTRLVIFDCDGTLTDGQAAVCRAMDLAFAESSLPAPDPHQVRRIVGLSLPQAVARLAPAADAATLAHAVDAYKSAFRAARLDGSLHEPLFPGMGELVRSLHARGWDLAVATGKSDRGTRSTLATHGLLACFASLQTADRHPSKPHPAMLLAALAETGTDTADAVMVGDTVYDMEAARAAGVRAIGVAWGYHEAHELLAAGASAVAATAAELEDLIHATTAT